MLLTLLSCEVTALAIDSQSVASLRGNTKPSSRALKIMSLLKFSHVVNLLETLEDLAHSTKLSNERNQRQKEDTILRTWFTEHEVQIHATDETRIALLSALLPGRRTDRVYGLGTSRLSHIFARCFRLGHARASQLYNWDQAGDEDFASLVCRLQEATEAGTPVIDPTLEEVDGVLHVLASRFHFSSPQIRQTVSNLSADEALASLCCHMRAKQLKWLVRLMLKNLAPVMLEEWKIFRVFHPLLPGISQLQAHFSAAISALRAIEESGVTNEQAEHVLSQQLVQKLVGMGRPGNMVPLRSYDKARSTKHCLQLMDGAKGKWSVETKYDGEYCQVHVDLSRGVYKCFQIFSKSQKDSTNDKVGVRGFLRDCLRIGRTDCGIQRNCILEGELLVYNVETNSIMPFDKIRQHVMRSGRFLGTAADDAVDPNERLMVMFFDIIALDDELLITKTYEQRRNILERIVHQVGNMLPRAETLLLNFDSISCSKHANIIEKAFITAIAGRLEGLVIKSCKPMQVVLEGNNLRVQPARTIKLKKDLIPGLGDSTDIAVVGATFDNRDPASIDLRKKGIRWTHFTLALLINKPKFAEMTSELDDPVRVTASTRLKFKVMAVISRPCITERDMLELSRSGQYLEEKYGGGDAQPQFDLLFDSEMPRPQVLFRVPFIVEVLGSSFEKPQNSNMYMLRHPRIVKIHRERSIQDVTSLEELQTMAKRALELPPDVQADELAWLDRVNQLAEAQRSLAHDLTPSDKHGGISILLTQSASTFRTPSVQHVSAVETSSAKSYGTTASLQSEGSVCITTSPRTLGSSSAQIDFIALTNMSDVGKDVDGSKTSGQKRKRSLTCSHMTPTRRVLTYQRSEEDKENVPAWVKRDQSCCECTRTSKTRRSLVDATNRIDMIDMQTSPGTQSNDLSSLNMTVSEEHYSPGRKQLASNQRSDPNPPDVLKDLTTVLRVLRLHKQGQYGVHDYQFQRATIAALIPVEDNETTPFPNHVIFLPPSQLQDGQGIIQGMNARQIISELLLPALGVSTSNGTLISNLDHWTRYILGDEHGQTSAVGESQAFPGFQKAVLAHRCQVDRLRLDLNTLMLAPGETVEVWDVDVVILSIQMLTCSPAETRSVNNAEELERQCLIGKMHRRGDGVNLWQSFKWESMVPAELIGV